MKEPGQAAAPRRRSQRAAGERAGAPAGAPGPAFRRSPVESAPRLLGLSLPLLIAGEVAVGALGARRLGAALTVTRVRRRGRREYALYVLHLSPHDEAKPQDLEDMMEAIANLVRAFPAERARHGQPFLAFELLHGPGAVRRARMVARRALRAARRRRARRRAQRRLPRRPPRPPARRDARSPRPATAAIPGHVMRFRKQRGFVYPLLAAGDELASPPLEAIAHAQAAARRAVRDPLHAHPRARPSSRRSRAGATAATRTGSCARNAGACPRAA